MYRKKIKLKKRRLSQTKSGRLLDAALPAKVSTFILSDIIGNPVHLIGSGPTIPFSENFDISELLKKYDLNPDPKIMEILISNNPPQIEQTPKFRIIGENRVMLDEVKKLAEKMGFDAIILGDAVFGEARRIGAVYADIARFLRGLIPETALDFSAINFPPGTVEKLRAGRDAARPLLIIAGGEPTVTLRGSGRGGRNQELALAFSEWRRFFRRPGKSVEV